ncbi:MAG: thiamine-monophosphate kinase [Verrucomicrobiaceae bacterium]|nr:thiamine-monophosphate kinase [Verrucomicrobiaceae bacterium]
MGPEPRLLDLGEDAVVKRLLAALPIPAPDVLVGPGDDCAVIAGSNGETLLLKTDAIVEGVHFLREAPAQKIGRKALARAISDIGAMGGTPKHALVTLVLPPDLTIAYVEGLYRGMAEVATLFGVSIVGGETARGSQIMISVALTGSATAGAVLRSTGRDGDLIWVTGRLGGSIKGHHFDFTPRVKEAGWLTQNFRPTAMMDLSDGLATDLPRLALTSEVGWEIDEALLPISEGCSAQQAWSDGEDYELLFTTDPSIEKHLMMAWVQVFPDVPLTRIGKMVPLAESSSLLQHGWDHFSK